MIARNVFPKIPAPWAAFFLVCLFLSPSVSSEAVDLFGFFALPPLPLALETPAWTATGSRLQLGYTREEPYRKWVGGQETQRFDGSRSWVALNLQFTDRVSLWVKQSLHGRQAWINHDPGKSETFDFQSRDHLAEGAIRLHGAHGVLSLETGKYDTFFEGLYQIDQSIVKALGTLPRIEFSNPTYEKRLRGYYHSGRWQATAMKAWGRSDHEIQSLGARMDLFIPFHRTFTRFESELDYRFNRRFSPYVRHEFWQEHGDGASFKNQKFIFGRTQSDFSHALTALGLTRHGRRSIFAEYSWQKAEGFLFLRNNLITLDTLFLFGTNEVQNRQTVMPIKPHGFRFGTRLPPWRSWTTSFEYGLTFVDLPRWSEDTKISNYRARRVITREYHTDSFRFHRLEADLRRRDRNGGWNILVRLMAPESVESKKEKAGAAAPGTGGGGAAPKPPKPSESVRGGWQLTLVRELSF